MLLQCLRSLQTGTFLYNQRPFCSQCSTFTAPTFAKVIQFKAKKFTFSSCFTGELNLQCSCHGDCSQNLSYTPNAQFFCSENAGNSISAKSNSQIRGGSCFIIHESSPGIWQSLNRSYSCCTCKLCRIVSMSYLCKTVYSSREEYSLQLQTTGMLDV